MFPNLFIVGAAKAGTTFLHNILNNHPDVYMSPEKEPRFFSRMQPFPESQHCLPAISGEANYRRVFKGATSQRIIGESSTSYLWDNQTASLLKNRIPNARIIIILRDPVERAYSHYLMVIRDYRQSLPFLEALKEDMERKGKVLGDSHFYMEFGLYYEQVKRYLKAFKPHQVLILMSEDLAKKTTDTLHQIAEFLNIDPAPFNLVNSGEMHNPFLAPRGRLARLGLSFQFPGNRLRYSIRKLLPRPVRWFIHDRLLLKKADKPPIDERAKRLLIDIYAPDLKKLEHLLSRDLSSLRRSW